MPLRAKGDEMHSRSAPGTPSMEGRSAVRISVSGFALLSSLNHIAISSQIAAMTFRPRIRRKEAVWTVIWTPLLRSMLSLVRDCTIAARTGIESISSEMYRNVSPA